MGTPFAAPVYSDGIDRARRDPAQLKQGWVYLEALRRNPPGQWGADRWEQVNHFRDIIYVAGRRVMSLFFAATYTPARRKRPRRGKTTFGPGGTVAKSVGRSAREGRDEDYTPIDDCDHPLYRLATRPNPHESMGRVTAKGILQYLLTGVYPAWCVPNANGRPVELYPLRTPFLYPQPPSPQYPRGAWRVTATGQGWMTNLPFGASAGTVLPGEEVARLLNPHPIIDYDGFSPLTAGGVQLDVLQSIDESRKSAMDSGLNLDAVMLVPGGEQATLDRLSAQMTEKAGGARNHRKFVALATQDFGAGGKTALETLGTAPKDMDYPQGWEQMTKFALALFGVPPAVAGLTPTGGNAELFAARRQFLDQQSGLVGEVGDFYTRCLADPYSSFPGEYVLQVKPQPVDDHEFRETQVKRRIDADLVTYNEARAMDDADPVPGGDVPVSIYLDTLKQKMAPPPQQPNLSPLGGGKPPLLPGATPTRGAPPGEELPEAEGTRPPAANRVAKAFDESKVKRDHGKFAAKEAHAERSKARESRRDAAGDARAHHDLSAPPVGSGWHEGLSDEQHAAALKQHWDDHATHTRTVRRKLEAAGASERELAEFDRRAEKARGALEKHHPRLAKLRAKAIAARKAADDHDALRDAIEAEEPEEPTPEDEPEEPDKPEPPVSEFPDLSPGGEPKREDYDSDGEHEDAVAQWESDVNDYDEFEKDYDEWEGERRDWREERAAVAARNEKAEAAHAKARAAWEKKLDRHDEKAEKLTERADDAESDHGAADDEYREEYEDGLGRVGEHVSDVEDRIIADADAEDEADPEPDDEDEDEPVGKAMSALTLSGGGALVPGGGAAVAGKRKKGRKCRPGLGRFLRRELKALGR